MDIEKELGMRVKFLRVRKGWTQDQLAEKLGYTSRAMVSKIEKGERGIKASMGFDKEETDSEFKAFLLGGIANSLSDDEDGFITGENAAQKLFEITERAFAKCKKGMN